MYCPVSDVRFAVDFYSRVFGHAPEQDTSNRLGCIPILGGAIQLVPPEAGITAGHQAVAIEVDDVEAAVSDVQENGGSVITSASGVAVVTDPFGNCIVVHEGSS